MRFTDKGFLVVCSLDKMHWTMHFIVKKSDKNWNIFLPFKKDLTQPILPSEN